MTLSQRIGTAFGIAASALVVAAAADASRITVVRDVSARDARSLPVKSIQIVRDVGARPAIARRRVPDIKVVRDTPARDAAQAARAIRYFTELERSGG